MFRFILLLIFIGFIATLGIGAVWYLRTPQPMGAYAQLHYARDVAIYEYYDLKKDRNADELAYWSPLADKGNALAQTHIAELYFFQGKDNADSYRVAAHYLNAAANKGLPSAQNAMGVVLRNGLSVDIDKVEAYKWFSLAARQGMALAKKNLADLTQELTDREKEQGDLRIQLWLKNVKTF